MNYVISRCRAAISVVRSVGLIAVGGTSVCPTISRIGAITAVAVTAVTIPIPVAAAVSLHLFLISLPAFTVFAVHATIAAVSH